LTVYETTEIIESLGRKRLLNVSLRESALPVLRNSHPLPAQGRKAFSFGLEFSNLPGPRGNSPCGCW